MRRALVSGSCILLLLLSCPAGAQTVRTLTSRDVDGAIALADAGTPEPYRLRHAGRPDNPVVVGVVYTPFVRVALLARAARDQGRPSPARRHRFEVDHTALVYIAFRWYCCDGAPAGENPDELAAAEPQVVMLPVAEKAPQYVQFTNSERRGAIKPVWSRKGTAVLEAFGATPPYDDIALVAAFPLEVLRARRPFAIYKQIPGRLESIRIGVIRADEVAGWR